MEHSSTQTETKCNRLGIRVTVVVKSPIGDYGLYMDEINEAIAEAVKREIRSAGTNITRLVKELGISRSTFYRSMKGDTMFRAEHLILIAEHLGIDVKALMPKREPARAAA